MKAIHNPYAKIIGNAAQFKIPVFQRDYSWTEAECDQLWRDVLRVAAQSTDGNHFLGSIVYISTEDHSSSFTRWLLIDGQQRVTTLTLIATALRDHIVDTGWTGPAEGPTAKRVEAYFLKNVQEEGDREYKLLLRRHDQATLKALLDRDELPPETSERIRDNYEFFREQLKKEDPEIVYRGLNRLIVIDVTLDRGIDDPQLIFESLNSTGIDLSQADLIRNFILMRLPEHEQTQLYEKYWRKIEDLFRGSEKMFDAFVRDYLALRTQANKQEKASEIYFAFRREFNAVGVQVDKLDELLADLLRFARYHAAFSIGVGDEPSLREPLMRLRHQVDVPAILIMRLYERHDAGTLSTSEFAKAIKLLESYIFRRAIVGAQTRGYWQVFANLAYRIDAERPLESLKVGLARQRENYRFPDDSEFQKALEEDDLYGKRICFQLLDSLENYDSKEPTDTSQYSIEHILPQNENLAPEWRDMLGDSWREIQREWLHRLGNLTLTGYNSSYSDRPFEDKKTIPGGFKESSVRLNRFVREQSQWTPKEMRLRSQQLATQALKIWPRLEVDTSLIRAAEQEEMRSRAKRRNVEKVPMTETSWALFEQLRERVKGLDSDIIELAEQKSVSYHAPAFFLEVLPRKNRLNLLLNLEFNEIDDPHGLAYDTSERKFFINAQYEGGVNVPIWGLEDIEKATPMIRQSHELARV